jgi:uncharacterized RDD family membrane protein YckC
MQADLSVRETQLPGFDLEAAISAWRLNLVQGVRLRDEEADELESHIRDVLDELAGQSLTPRDAWLVACRRMGDADALHEEFRKFGASTDFLPLKQTNLDGNEEPVYALAAQRFFAHVFDMGLAYAPLLLLNMTILHVPLYRGPLIVFGCYLFVVACWALCTYRWGGTPAQLLIGLRVTRPDGARLPARQVLLHYSPMIVLGVLAVIAAWGWMEPIDPRFYPAGQLPLYPLGSLYMGFPTIVYFFLPLTLLCFLDSLPILLTPRKRAFHNWLAGTVVINAQFARIAR